MAEGDGSRVGRRMLSTLAEQSKGQLGEGLHSSESGDGGTNGAAPQV